MHNKISFGILLMLVGVLFVASCSGGSDDGLEYNMAFDDGSIPKKDVVGSYYFKGYSGPLTRELEIDFDSDYTGKGTETSYGSHDNFLSAHAYYFIWRIKEGKVLLNGTHVSIDSDDDVNGSTEWSGEFEFKQGKFVPGKGFIEGYAEQVLGKTNNNSSTDNTHQNDNSKSVTSISLNKSNLYLILGKSEKLYASIDPVTATNKNVTWSSSNTSVAKVDQDGVVTALSKGSCVVKATSNDGGKIASCNVEVRNPNFNGHEYVDLGLSVYWATCNVGASSYSSFGNYYAWGEISTKNSYKWSNYKFGNGKQYENDVRLSKYNKEYSKGEVDYKTQLELADDIAHIQWGGSWRMPTINEFNELIENCTWTRKSYTSSGRYGTYTFVFIEIYSNVPGYTSNCIRIPLPGMYDGGNNETQDSFGYYWSSTLSNDNSYYAFGISLTDWAWTGAYERRVGMCVRPVCK